MSELLFHNYYFPTMKAFIKEYIGSCDLCAHAKASQHQTHRELAPLPVPNSPWISLLCNFITDLLPLQNYNSILVFVDCLTKMSHFIPCHKMTTAPQFAKLFIKNIVCLHGLPDSVVSDHSSIFTSLFWKTLANNLSINHNLSTAFYPQTDGQTEHMNQILEQYLRLYCNYQQDDWYNLLLLPEFAYNNAYQNTIKASPFYANYGHHPHFDPELHPKTME